jgi:hypothetical protein
MKRNCYVQIAIIITALVFSSCRKSLLNDCNGNNNTTATVKVFATGLNNPRGLKFGPDGNLYVAEGGKGGTNTTSCVQVIPPVGPYKGSETGAGISKIGMDGFRTVVTDRLPSTVNVLGQISGVGDIEFVGNDLYALLTGAGCSHGVTSLQNSVLRINRNGSRTMIANLSFYLETHPVKNPEEDDFEPDGDWYSMTHVNDNLYAIEANHGELVRISLNGTVTRIADISASQGHIVPTALLFHDGNFYVGNLNPFPIVDGSSKIYKISPSGDVQVFATGFTTILGITMDNKNRLYVLENTTGNPFPTPNTGRVVRLDQAGKRDIIATGLNLPTAITYGPDGNLYVSNVGFGPSSIGGGEVLQLKLNRCDCDIVDYLNK